MVALKAGRLTHTDLFRGVLWTVEQWNAKRHELMLEANEDGFEEPDLFFETSRRMEIYQQSQPSMRERQAIAAKIIGRNRVETNSLTPDELQYILDKLSGSNVETGKTAALKIQNLLDRLKTT